jgi:cytochrome c-type biogenesis protein
VSKYIVVAVMVVALAGVIVLKHQAPTGPATQADAKPEQAPDEAPAFPEALPRLVDVGGTKCIPCKRMVPVLDALEREYKGQLIVERIDSVAQPELQAAFGVQIIPTQIFFDADGVELDRNSGPISKEEIVAMWAAHGVELTSPEPPDPPGLMSTLTRAVKGSAALALGASFVWGILSVLLSPCHLTSIPLIVGFIDKQGRTTTRRAFIVSTAFAVGILITIGAVGAITATAGLALGDIGSTGNYIVAGILVLVALVLLDVVPLPFSGPSQVALKRKGVLAAFVLGLVFGIAIGPCTFAYMAPMLMVTIKFAAVYGALLLLAYGVGHCSVIVLAGTSTELVQRYLDWNERSRGAVWTKRVCGALVFLGGLYLIYTAR